MHFRISSFIVVVVVVIASFGFETFPSPCSFVVVVDALEIVA